MVKSTSTAPPLWVNQSEHRGVDWEELSEHFMKPMGEAANKLGVCEKYLRKITRNFGVKRWPRQQIIQLEKKKEHILTYVRDATDRNFQLDNVDKELTKIFEQPNSSVEIKPRRNKFRNQKTETNEPTVKEENESKDIEIEIDMDVVLKILT